MLARSPLQDLLEYKKKHRTLRVKMLDETVKTVLVDDSNTVQELVATVCQKIGAVACASGQLLTEPCLNETVPMCPLQLRPAGIHNSEEYSFTTERLEEAAAQKRAHDPKAKGDSTRSAAFHLRAHIWR